MTVYARPTNTTTAATIPPGHYPTKPTTKTTPHNAGLHLSTDRVRGCGAQDRLCAGERPG